MNIKEIALKHAREYLTFKLGDRKGLDVEEIVCDDEIYKEIVNELAQQFEAIIAEIAKQNDPVAWGCPGHPETFVSNNKKQNSGYQSMVFFSEPLYTFPPDKAQIEQETAEACAKYVNRFLNGDGIQDEAWIRDIESGIRRGAWKEFKK